MNKDTLDFLLVAAYCPCCGDDAKCLDECSIEEDLVGTARLELLIASRDIIAHLKRTGTLLEGKH